MSKGTSYSHKTKNNMLLNDTKYVLLFQLGLCTCFLAQTIQTAILIQRGNNDGISWDSSFGNARPVVLEKSC